MTIDKPRQAVFQTAGAFTIMLRTTSERYQGSALLTRSPELLENILLQLPAINIFGVQRVCRQFRDLISSSVALQEQMFLRSSAVERETWVLK